MKSFRTDPEEALCLPEWSDPEPSLLPMYLHGTPIKIYLSSALQ